MLLFVSAEPRELTGLLRRCSNLRRENLPVHWAASALLGSRPILAIANGAGWKRAYAAVAGPDLEMVCSVGFCGALDPALRVADVFVATAVNGEAIARPTSALPCRSGRLVSIDHVARTADEKRTLHEQGSDAVEMEAFGVLQAARSRGVPFCAVRCVSDLAEESFQCDFARVLRDDGSIDKAKLALQALLRPLTCLPELIRLGKRTALASERLGEFLASCEF